MINTSDVRLQDAGLNLQMRARSSNIKIKELLPFNGTVEFYHYVV